MSVISQEVKSIFNRSVWYYIVVILVFSVAVDYKKVVKERAHYLLGVFYNQDLQNYKDGIVYFDYLIHQKSKDSRNYFLLGYCYLQLLDYHRALHYFERALKLAPNDVLNQQYLDFTNSKVLNDGRNVVLPIGSIPISIE